MEEVDLGQSFADEKAALRSRPEHPDGVVLDQRFGVSAERLRDMVFMDSREGSVYHSFLKQMTYFDVQVGEFRSGAGGGKERVVSFKISSPMGRTGPKEVDAEDSQVIVLENSCGLVMESSCKTSKVMYSNSFTVDVQHKIIADSPSANECVLHCTVKVNFVKSVMGMIKKQIRAESVKQMHKKYSTLGQCIAQALQASPSSAAAENSDKLEPLLDIGLTIEGQSQNGHLSSSETEPVPLMHRRNDSGTDLKRDTAKSDSKVSGWLLKRSDKLRKWNTRYCEFDFVSGRFEWRKRPDDPTPNGFMMINIFTEVQNKDIQRGVHPQGMEECSFLIVYEKKKYYFSADTDRAMDMWCTAMKEYIQSCSSKVMMTNTSFDDSPTMVAMFSIGQVTDMDHLDSEKKPDRMAYFRMSVGNHVKRSKTIKTSTSGTWNQTFSFPILMGENPEIILYGEECYSDSKYAQGKTIGMCSLPLWAFPPNEAVKFWACLRSSAHMSSPISGKVQVHLIIKNKYDVENLDTEDGITIFEEEGKGNHAGEDVRAESSRKAEGGAGENSFWTREYSLLDLLCCGLVNRGRKPKASSQYQLLQEMDDL
ncbi:hypothetical protein HOP50_10g57950 [Chloropicon primus]|uniref:PH domain-containing protein n=1 Tax=Chloropicon primus TaxID=1764295 RepID=A0A5B8MSK9_9CHLO|nr:hypothetical protein A3770_10p57750 [Chloropicon primus]UPR02469.1 hypothetical protein HOP50_10g57950 [Chloropicon primus]|eukprot:QDZ23257.1 hypothetical protein A3770_10p57750 [Chloropicon primus]